MKRILPIPLLISSLLFSACSDSEEPAEGGAAAQDPAATAEAASAAKPDAPAAVEPAAVEVDIVTLTAPDSGLDPAKLGAAQIAEHSLEKRFPAAAAADSLVITVDASGLRPLHKEQILLAGLLQPSKTIVVLTGSDAVGEGSADANFDAAAWLAKQAAELQTLCAAYGVKDVLIATDSAAAAGDLTVKGWEAVLAAAAEAAPRAVPERSSVSSAEATITIQKMSEAPSPHAIQTIKNSDKKDLVFGGGAAIKAVIELDDPVAPGNSGPAELQLEEAADLAVGDKFIITRMGSVVGFGEITEL